MTQSDAPNENNKMTWFDTLAYYTKDFTKDEMINLVSYIAWVKCESELKEAEEIKTLISNQHE